MKKSRQQQSPLKSILMAKGDIRIELILLPEMMVKIEAADDWDFWSVPFACRQSPAVAIAYTCQFFWQDRPGNPHPDIAELRQLAELMWKYPSGLPIIQIMSIGWHLPIPGRKAAA